MAAVNLPDSPANGTTQTVGGITYTYNSSKGYWTAASSGGGGGGGASVSTSDAAPGSPSDGDLWYDTDDGGMFVYYQDTDSSQWVEVIGSQGAAGPAGADGGAGVASVYATVDALPTSGNTQGDMAHVTANNTLYFWNGSGWYKIALINTTPSISGANAAYTLAVDGTATTVTLVASDPEGLPITYSIASDTSGNTATVSQGTGANTNVFTITPSTNQAYAGSFTLTFRASDGVNIATAVSSFTLAFRVINSNYTTAMITSVGSNNGVNNNFVDSSTNNHTITSNGNARQITFSPYRHGGYSMEFNGSNTSLSLSPHADFAFNTGDFTIEWWCKLPDQSNTMFIDWRQGGSGNGNLHIGTGGYGGSLAGAVRFTGDGPTIVSTSVVDDNEWHHVAICRASGTTKMYIDGTQEGSATDTTSYDRQGLRIGNNSYSSGGNHLNGLIADLRLVRGTAVYTSNFTPPTETLTAITNTKLLLGTVPYIKDHSGQGHAVVNNNSTGTSPSRPFDNFAYNSAEHGGSLHFDGVGDFITAGSNSNTIGTGDFTAEFWCYRTATGGSWQTALAQRASNHTQGAEWVSGMTGSGYSYFYSSGHHINTTAGDIPVGAWTHVAYTREGSTLRCFINGILKGTATSFTNNFTYGPISVGANQNGTEPFTGNIAEPRIINGTALYTSAFTPPAAPLTAVTNTNFLVKGINSSIIDKSQSIPSLFLWNDTKSSTAQYKFLTSSMYFDGTGDYISTQEKILPIVQNIDYTVEGWFWATDVSGYYPIIQQYTTGSDPRRFNILIEPNVLKFLLLGLVEQLLLSLHRHGIILL